MHNMQNTLNTIMTAVAIALILWMGNKLASIDEKLAHMDKYGAVNELRIDTLYSHHSDSDETFHNHVEKSEINFLKVFDVLFNLQNEK